MASLVGWPVRGAGGSLGNTASMRRPSAARSGPSPASKSTQPQEPIWFTQRWLVRWRPTQCRRSVVVTSCCPLSSGRGRCSTRRKPKRDLSCGRCLTPRGLTPRRARAPACRARTANDSRVIHDRGVASDWPLSFAWLAHKALRCPRVSPELFGTRRSARAPELERPRPHRPRCPGSQLSARWGVSPPHPNGHRRSP